MLDIIIQILVSAVAFFAGAKLLRGVTIHGFSSAVVVAAVVALLNATIGWIFTVLTLGLMGWGIFALILDAIVIKIADYFLDTLSVKNFWWALILALIVTLFTGFAKWILA